ncbi:hypothetical protein PG994_010538 [Apiospora phragmitis]|uniref:GPI anchored serine-rich protein n=1 Tax=Apiospora phragmitis TaxID=2905665 RepID=A0ABR1TQ76_9PEZI
MHASSILVLAAGAMSASAAVQGEQQLTTTSTSTMTHYVTITKCNPTNTLCPLYTPSTTSSSIVSTTSSTSSTPSPTSYPVFTPPPAPAPTSSSSSSSSSSSVFSSSSSSAIPVYSVKSFPAHNTTTTAVFPTAYYNTTTPKSTPAMSKPATLTGYPTAPAPSPIPTGGAASLQSGLTLGAVAAVAALML